MICVRARVFLPNSEIVCLMPSTPFNYDDHIHWIQFIVTSFYCLKAYWTETNGECLWLWLALIGLSVHEFLNPVADCDSMYLARETEQGHSCVDCLLSMHLLLPGHQFMGKLLDEWTVDGIAYCVILKRARVWTVLHCVPGHDVKLHPHRVK